MAEREPTWKRLSDHVAGEVRRNEPLAPRTSIRVGGAAELFIRPADVESLCTALAILADDGVPVRVLGGGANTIVSDAGLPGAVIRLPTSGPERLESREGGIRITLPAGAPIARLIQQMREHRTVGAEFLAGVPGTLGGAVAMNAGTREGWIQKVLVGILVATPTGIVELSAQDLSFAYRSTRWAPEGVVVAATFELLSGDVEASERQMSADLAYRRRTQPLNLPNSGSTFVNPPGESAGRLIEAAGLKGHQIGAAQISALHANFIVNLGGARAAEVKALMDKAKSEVRSRFGVELIAEVKLVGEF
jgi:UDP-N-acetylmuramate dehydrogenase